MRLSLILSVLAALIGSLVPAAAAQKATVGIGDFKNGANVQHSVADVLVDMIATSLTKSRKFDVVERQRLGEIFDEQNLGASGAVDPSTAANIGKLKGADYLLLGTVTEADTSHSVTVVPAGKIGRSSATLACDIRFVDSTTGSTVFTETYRASRSATGVSSHFGSFDIRQGIGHAMAREVVDKLTYKVMTSVFPPKVIKRDGDTVMLNYGDALFSVGQVWDVYSRGEALVDPDTGEVLGEEEEQVGRVQITEVKPKYSKARVVSGNVPDNVLLRRSASSGGGRNAAPEREKVDPF